MSIFAVFAASMLVFFGIQMIVIFGIKRIPRIITYFWILRPSFGILLRSGFKMLSQPLLVSNTFCRFFDYKPFPCFVPSNPLKGLLFIVSSPEDVAVVIKSKHLCDKSEFYYKETNEYLRENVLVTNGEVWRNSRKTIDYGFNKQTVESYFDEFKRGSQKLLDKLQKNYAETDCYIQNVLFEHFLSSALLLTTSTEFPHRNITLWHETIQGIFYLSHRKTMEPFFSWYKFLLPVQQRTKADIDEANSIILNIIVNHKKKTENLLKSSGNTFRANSILEHIVVKHSATGKMLPVSYKQLTSDLIFVAVAGAETTSTTITLTMAMLALHPETQQKVREEVRSVLGESNRPMTLDDLKHMTQLENVIKETLRLFPPVPMVARSVKEDVNINGTLMPKGSTVVVNFMALHRNPHAFENPDQFDPNRFLPENVHKIPPYAYVPFSFGGRKCPGNYYAMIQMKTCIASLIRKFEILPGEDLRTLDDIPIETRITLYFTKKVDIYVKLLEPGKATS